MDPAFKKISQNRTWLAHGVERRTAMRKVEGFTVRVLK